MPDRRLIWFYTTCEILCCREQWKNSEIIVNRWLKDGFGDSVSSFAGIIFLLTNSANLPL